MAIVPAELKFYGSGVMAEDDTTGGVGGAVAPTVKIEFTDISPAGTVEILSSAGGDISQNVTVTGRNAAGEIITEAKTLNGVTPVAYTLTFERILKVAMSASAAGTVTLRKTSAGGDLMTLEPGITTVRRPFYNAAAPASGTKDYYEKVFVKNTNGSLTLTSAVVKEQGDPSGKITFGLATTLNDSGTVANRLTAPGGISFDSANKNVANGQNLTAGAVQGVWLKLSLADTDSATKTTYTVRLEGNSI